jgi:ATP-dependent RNA helicase MSS116, mitochondrial
MLLPCSFLRPAHRLVASLPARQVAGRRSIVTMNGTTSSVNEGVRGSSRGRGGSRGGRGAAGARGGRHWHPPRPSAGIVKPVSPRMAGSVAVVAAAAATVATKAVARTSNSTRADMGDTLFAELPLHPNLLRAVDETMGYTNTTQVQAKSIPLSIIGSDLLVKAKTGTGKTLAFLLPAFDRVLRERDHHVSDQGQPTKTGRKQNIDILVISPTRELAQQISEEADVLLQFESALRTQTVFGGTNIKSDTSSFRRDGMPTLLVATPGRLLDHLDNSDAGLANGLKGLKVLVLDEADRLLDMGFRPDLERILAYLPPVTQRQTLLFSATMPEDVRTITKVALRSDYDTVDCVGNDANTHERVPQYALVTPIDDQIAALGCCLVDAMRIPDYKILVFFTTARVTQFFAELFTGIGRPVLEMHSRKSQPHRTRMSEQFRNNSSLIMFSSDVTARGLDFPDVTSVIQVGLPADREQYIHRLGRTARAGKNGSGVLLLSDFEAAYFLAKVSDLPLQTLGQPPRAMMDQFAATAAAGCKMLPAQTKTTAYQAWMGFYNTHLRALRWDKTDLVAMANHWITAVVGDAEPPELQARTVGKMGLRDVPGIRVEGRAGSGARKRGDGAGGGRGGGSNGASSFGGRGGRGGGSASVSGRGGSGDVRTRTNGGASGRGGGRTYDSSTSRGEGRGGGSGYARGGGARGGRGGRTGSARGGYPSRGDFGQAGAGETWG